MQTKRLQWKPWGKRGNAWFNTGASPWFLFPKPISIPTRAYVRHPLSIASTIEFFDDDPAHIRVIGRGIPISQGVATNLTEQINQVDHGRFIHSMMPTRTHGALVS